MLEPAFNELAKNEELWDIFTRKEEYSPPQLDKHGRFYHQGGAIDQPLVSQFLKNIGHKPEYPEGRSFALCLTHDVDEIYPPFSHTIQSSIHCLRRMDLSGSVRQFSIGGRNKQRSPYLNFEHIMEMESKYGAKSSFYLLATDRDILRFRYNIEEIGIELGKVVDKGWEVGLHTGYYAYNDLKEIIEEKKRLENVLGRTVIGCRNHYLRFRVPDTWHFLSTAGFKYDTTLGYPDAIGFRNGMCHPFRPYDLQIMDGIEIMEIPMAIMDMTLFDNSRSYENALLTVKSLIDTVRTCNGVLVLNWHNNSFNCPFRDNWSKIYDAALKYAVEQNAWLASGEEIWRFFSC